MKKVLFLLLVICLPEILFAEEVPAGYVATWNIEALSESDYVDTKKSDCQSFASVLRNGKIEQPEVIGIKIVKETLANFIKGYKNKENIIFDTVVIWPNYEQSDWYVLMSYESCFIRWIEIQPDNIQSIIEDGKHL